MPEVTAFKPGPAGPPGGAGGAKGADGRTPYQIAVEETAFTGTEAEWLASLHGEVVVLAPDIVGGVHVTDITADTPIYGGVHVTDL